MFQSLVKDLLRAIDNRTASQSILLREMKEVLLEQNKAIRELTTALKRKK